MDFAPSGSSNNLISWCWLCWAWCTVFCKPDTECPSLLPHVLLDSLIYNESYFHFRRPLTALARLWGTLKPPDNAALLHRRRTGLSQSRKRSEFLPFSSTATGFTISGFYTMFGEGWCHRGLKKARSERREHQKQWQHHVVFSSPPAPAGTVGGVSVMLTPRFIFCCQKHFGWVWGLV